MAQQQRRHNPKKRRRGRHSGLYTVLSAGLILAAMVAAVLIFFRIGAVEYAPGGDAATQTSGIQVQGNRRYTDREIIAVSGVKAGDNLFTVSASRVSRSILSQLPYVSTVKVKRAPPSQLIIQVTEGDALAAVELEGQWWLLDAQGKLLEQAAGPGSLATVTGITPLAPAVGTYLAVEESQSARLPRLKELLAGLDESGLMSGLEWVDLSEDYRLTFALDGRFTVHISPTLEKGTSYWLRRLSEYIRHESIAGNYQRYTVEIMDDQNVRFIPD